LHKQEYVKEQIKTKKKQKRAKKSENLQDNGITTNRVGNIVENIKGGVVRGNTKRTKKSENI